MKPRCFALCLIWLLLFLPAFTFSQTDSVFKLILPKEKKDYRSSPATKLDRFWKYHKGDNTQWAAPDFNDKDWKNYDTKLEVDTLPAGTFEGIGWFRIHLEVDTALVNTTLGFMILQFGATEIYLDGKLIHAFGKIDSKDPKKEERYNPLYLPVDIRFENSRRHILAIRYSDTKAAEDVKAGRRTTAGFEAKIGKLRENVIWHYINSSITSFCSTESTYFALPFDRRI